MGLYNPETLAVSSNLYIANRIAELWFFIFNEYFATNLSSSDRFCKIYHWDIQRWILLP